MWKAIEMLKQGKSINNQDLETNLYWEFGKFTSRDGESLKSYYLRFHKLMNELVRNQCDVTNHHVNVQFLLQLQPEWQRLARTANSLALVAQQQPVYHPQNHPTHYTHNSLTKSQQTATRNRGKEIVNSSTPIYDQAPAMVAEDDEMSKDKEIDKLMALISLSFKKIYKPTNNNLICSSNTSRENKDNTLRINRGIGYDNQMVVNVAGARENVGKNNDDNYNVFSIESEHPEQPESVNDTYLVEQDEHTMIIDSLDTSYDKEQVDQDDDDLAKERDLLASLIEKLKCEIDDVKNRNKFLETSNKALVDKSKGEIKEFKTKTKSLESLNNHCGSFDFNISLSLNEYKGLATLDKSKTTKRETLFMDQESMRNLD
nr:hypothetical protein [Tanacetum cinerariifolium]